MRFIRPSFLLSAITVFSCSFSLNSAAWELQWLGHAAFKITSDKGKVVLIDPFIINNPKTPKTLKDLKKFEKTQLILITHGHGDHIGDAIELAKISGATVAMNADMKNTFSNLKMIPDDQLIGFNKSGTIEPVKGVKVTMVRAEHSSSVKGKDPTTGHTRMFPGGEPAGYIIEMENGDRIYHAGDTGVFADMALIGELYQPVAALLPIGGHYTMDPSHAAKAVDLLKPKMVIPMHFGTFGLLKGTPAELKARLDDQSSLVKEMKPGEVLTF